MLQPPRPTGRVRVAVVALLLAPVGVASQSSTLTPAPRVDETVLELADGPMRYGIAIPDGYERDGGARPLVLALHPGGSYPYYGSSFMRTTVEPALRPWGAVIVAPDVPDRSWTTPRAERMLLELIERVRDDYAIDPDRVLVTGFSMGGRGTWFMAARHPDVFTGAIVMAGMPSDEDVEALSLPLYLIHSPDDEVVPFEPVEEAYMELAGRGHAVEFRVLPGAGHYQMGAYVLPLRLAAAWMGDRW